MAGPRETELRRCHVRAIPLLDVRPGVAASSAENCTVDFVCGQPDGRVRCALSVLFVPRKDAFVDIGSPFAADHPYLAAGHTLAVMAREKGMEQGGHMHFVDAVYGRFGAPVSLPPDVFGWHISDEFDARELYGQLKTLWQSDPIGYGESGTWIARATYTDRVGMAEDEWERLADRIYLRALRENVRVTYRAAG